MHIQNVWKIVIIYRFFITPVASGRRALGLVQLRCKKWRAGQGWGSSKRPRSPRPAQKRIEVLKNHALPYDFIDLSSSADRFLMLEMLVLVRSWPQNHASGSARPSLQAIPSAKKTVTGLLVGRLSFSGAWGLKSQNPDLWWSRPGKNASGLKSRFFKWKLPSEIPCTGILNQRDCSWEVAAWNPDFVKILSSLQNHLLGGIACAIYIPLLYRFGGLRPPNRYREGGI